MKKRLKNLKQILSEHRFVDGDDDDILLYYDNDTMTIDRLMKKHFGSEIEVETCADRWQGLDWYWKDDWFESDVELLEDELFEI